MYIDVKYFLIDIKISGNLNVLKKIIKFSYSAGRKLRGR